MRRWKRFAGVLGGFQHFLDFRFGGIEREFVRHAGFGVVEFQRDFVELVAAVASGELHAIAERLHLCPAMGLKPCAIAQILPQHVERIHAGDGGRHRQAHGVAQRFFGGDLALLDGFAVTAERLHTKCGDSAPVQLGQAPVVRS